LDRISYDHLRLSDARGRFKSSEIDARDVDFSDRISGKRKSYRASSRRRRRRVAGGYEVEDEEESEYEDYEENYGEESLERRLARLKKEVEVLKGDIANRDEVERSREEEEMREAAKESGNDDEEGGKTGRELRSGIDDLSDVLERLQTISGEERGAQAKLAKKLATSLAVAATPKAVGRAASEKVSPEVGFLGAFTFLRVG
jgi:nuclear migration protein JNM1